MAELTTNYGLTKPLDNDFIDITVLDSNYDLIDSTMKGIEEKTDKNISDFSEFEGEVSSTYATKEELNTAKSELEDKKADKTEVTKQIADEVAKIVANAPEEFDTLKEMSDWITDHKDSASKMNTAIETNKINIAANTKSITELQAKISNIPVLAKKYTLKNSISFEEGKLGQRVFQESVTIKIDGYKAISVCLSYAIHSSAYNIISFLSSDSEKAYVNAYAATNDQYTETQLTAITVVYISEAYSSNISATLSALSDEKADENEII